MDDIPIRRLVISLILVMVSFFFFLNSPVFRSKVEIVRPDPQTPRISHLNAINKLVACESSGRNITIMDSNGRWSRGILQYQDRTWEWFSKLSGIKGTSTNPTDAIAMTEWAIENGKIGHWSCAHLLGMVD